MSCIVSGASYRITAIDLFYDGTNHTINYVDENSARVLRVIVWELLGVQHTDGWTPVGL